MEINEKSKNQFNADTDAYKIFRAYIHGIRRHQFFWPIFGFYLVFSHFSYSIRTYLIIRGGGDGQISDFWWYGKNQTRLQH